MTNSALLRCGFYWRCWKIKGWKTGMEHTNSSQRLTERPSTCQQDRFFAVHKVTDAPPLFKKGDLIVKALNVLHGNRDRDRFSVRGDSVSANLAIVLLLITIGFILSFIIGTTDVKGAYFQRGPARRDIFIHPPKKLIYLGRLCKLL